MSHPEDRRPAGQRFTERESARILRRAVELQEKSGASGPGGGHSLEELKQIAREVGVDPRHVVEAVERLDRRPAGKLHFWLGGPTQIQQVNVVPGRLRPGEAQSVIDEIRRLTGRHGHVTMVADALEWRAKDSMGGSYVSVSGVGGETRVRVIGVRSEGAITVFTIGGSVGLIGTLLIAKALAPIGAEAVVPAIAGTVAATWLAARAIWSRSTRKWQDRLRRMLGGVTDVVSRATDSQPGEEASRPADPRAGAGPANS